MRVVLVDRGRPGRETLLALAPLMGAGLVAILLVGWRPYVTNTLEHGTSAYFGESDFMERNSPAGMATLNPVMGLIHGVLSRPSNSYNRPILVFPGLEMFDGTTTPMSVDQRKGGFGHGFATLYTFALALGLLHAKTLWQRRGHPGVGLFLALAGLSLILTLALPYNWWARYVPQHWLVPIGLLLAQWSSGAPGQRARIYSLFGLALAAMICVMVARGTWSYQAWERERIQIGSTRLLAAGPAHLVGPENPPGRIWHQRLQGWSPTGGVAWHQTATPIPDAGAGAIFLWPDHWLVPGLPPGDG